MQPKHPYITSSLTDGNVFALIGTVRRDLIRNGVPKKEVDEFQREATSGDYDHALQTIMKWVNVQ